MHHPLFLALILAITATTASASEWPAQVVTIEEMRLLTPMRIRVPVLREKGEVVRPVVLRVHVDTSGHVLRAALLESSGSPSHDEAAMHSMRSARFVPKEVDGVPVEVTLAVPLHLPLKKAATEQ